MTREEYEKRSEELENTLKEVCPLPKWRIKNLSEMGFDFNVDKFLENPRWFIKIKLNINDELFIKECELIIIWSNKKELEYNLNPIITNLLSSIRYDISNWK